MMPLQIQFLLFILAGWVNRQQQDVIEYLRAENRALREQLGGKRLRFTDAQRRRIARKANSLLRKLSLHNEPCARIDQFESERSRALAQTSKDS
jgi:hypothetical protein